MASKIPNAVEASRIRFRWVCCQRSRKLGLCQVSSLMFLMPMLIFTWCYFIGWLLDRWKNIVRDTCTELTSRTG